MNRYYGYLIALPMLGNIVSLSAIHLIHYTDDGAVSSILIAIPAGAAMFFAFTSLFSRFPGKGLPEILEEAAPVWLGKPFLLIQSVLWGVAGLIVLLYISDVAERFVNPGFAPLEALSLFLIATVLFAHLPSMKLLYMIEILMMVFIPFVLFVILKAITSESLMMDSMLEAATHAADMPRYVPLSAGVYSFTGYMYLTVFNREIAPKRGKLALFTLLVALVGGFNLCMTFFIPIGFHGMDGVDDYIYPWFATADSMRLRYGFIERLLFIFLMLYIMISVVHTLASWHVGVECWKSLLPRRVRTEWVKKLHPYGYLTGMCAAALMLEDRLTLGFVYELSEIWMWVQAPNAAVVLCLLVWALYRRNRRGEGKEVRHGVVSN